MTPSRVGRTFRFGPALLLTLVAGCFPFGGDGLPLDGPPPEPDPGPTPEAGFCEELIGREAASFCKRNIDCEAGSTCEKVEDADVDDWGCCAVVFCQRSGDCAAGQLCQTDVGLCVDEQPCGTGGADGCAEGQVCTWQSGSASCVTPSPAACEIVPAALWTGAGAPTPFDVLWLDAQGQPTEAPITIAATSDVGSLNGSGDLLATCAGPEPCAGVLTARSGDVSCEAAVTVLPDADTTRLVVIDAASGAPLDARVHVLDSAGVGTTVDTTAGVAVVAGEVVTATALAGGYRTLTLVDAVSGDVVLPLSRVPEGVAGVRGELAFDRLRPSISGDIAFGVAGLSIGTPGVDLTLERFFGLDDVQTIPPIEGITDPDDPLIRQMPSAIGLTFGVSVWKGPLLAVGEPGERIVWSLASRQRLANAQRFFRISSQTWAQVAALEMLHDVTVAASAASGSVAVDASPAPTPDSDGALDYSEHEAAIDLAEGAVALSPEQLPYWRVELEVPELPCGGGSCADRALVLVGADVPGRGVVPLGVTSRSDALEPEDEDQRLSAGGLSSTDGVVRVAFAPPHGGVDGPLTAWLLVFGARLQADGDGRPVAFMQWPDVGLDTTQPPPAPDFGPRITVTADATDGVTFSSSGAAPDVIRHHATLGGAPWEILFAGQPGGAVDLRALLPGDVTAAIDHEHTQAITLRTEADLGAIVAPGGLHLGELDRWVAASRSDR